MKDANEEDDGGAFDKLMGAFGTHANTEKRAKAERMAGMSPRDRRRRVGPPRDHQYNGRITAAAHSLAKACEKQRGYGSGGLIEEGVELIAKKYGIKVDA